MKIAVIGGRHTTEDVSELLEVEPGFYGEEKGYVADHSICSSTLGLARALRKHGYESFVWVKGPIEADAAIISEYNFMETVYTGGLWDFTKPTIVWLHNHVPGRLWDGHRLKQLCDGICFTRQEALDKFALAWGIHKHPYWVAEWAYPDWWQFPPEKENPYSPGSKNAVYAGRIETGGKIAEILIYVAKRLPGLTLNIIATCQDESIIKRLKSLPNVNYLGNKTHGTFLNYLYYADIALDTGIAWNREANNCKIWDYLAAGLPVIIDGTTGGIELIEKTGSGIIVPRGELILYGNAVESALTKTWSRDEVRDYMRKNYTYEAVMGRWISHVKTLFSEPKGGKKS